MLSGIAAGISKVSFFDRSPGRSGHGSSTEPVKFCFQTAAAPIERVKLLVQNQDEMIKQGRLDKPYNGVMDCTKRTLAGEGITPFWRGNLANIIRYAPTQALNFAFKDKFKANFIEFFNVPKDAPCATKMSVNIASGGCAGHYSLFFVYPLDYIHTRLANDCRGLIDVYKKTKASDGIAGLYRGFTISSVGIFLYRGLYFGIYDTARPIFIGEDGSFMASFALGWAGTVVSGLVSYPIDTIRRRTMLTSGTGK